MENVKERFLRYIKIDTQSCDGVEQFPSTEKQLDLARLLESELANEEKSREKTDADIWKIYAGL